MTKDSKTPATEISDKDLDQVTGGKGESFTATDDLANRKKGWNIEQGSAWKVEEGESWTIEQGSALKDAKDGDFGKR